MILLKQMILFFLMMLLGYYSAKKGIIDEKVSKSLSWIVVNLANPALILSGNLSVTKISTKNIITANILAVSIFVALILVAELLLPLLRFKKEDLGVYKVMLVFSNMGFMGFPIVAAVYGTSALMYAAASLIPFNLLIYTYGVICMGAKNEKGKLSKICNIGVVACILSLVITLLKIPIPNTAGNAIKMLSNLTAPLSMMVIGASFLPIRIRELVSDGKMLIFTVIRLLIVPLVGVTIIKGIVSDPVLCGVSLVALAAPAGSMTVMLAQQYDGQVETATKGVALTTLLSVITMPLVFAIMKL